MSADRASDPAAAATALVAALPPLNKMALVAIWVETILYGVNIVVYSGAAYVLLGKRKRASSVQSCLFAASTLLFAFSTAHVAVSLRQLVQAFTNPSIAAVPGGSSLYFLNQTDHLVFAGQLIYLLDVLVQDLVLIWRLFAVMGGDRRVVVLPLILEALNQASALYTLVKVFDGTSVEDPGIRPWGILNWSLHLIINIGVTAAIAAKIWWQGRLTIDVRGHNAYAGVAYTIMESGGLFAGATLVLFILYINTSTGLDALVGVSPVSQLATLSPLLIIVRVGFGLTHGSFNSANPSGSANVVSTARFGSNSEALRIDVHSTQVSDYTSSRDLFAMRAVKSDTDADSA
ncbi:hypothetical protein C8Q79DRAFT_134666 [Trametes meyenii]|nr:hypothetical protein C8Q79DRAFT_134666 [Trametes meyenii]